jgi:hypothetical protein
MVTGLSSDEVELLPSSKDDMAAVVRLQRHIETLGVTTSVVKALPELMDWLADPHWDVARPLAQILATLGDQLERPVQAILRGNDNCHKFAVMSLLLNDLPLHALRTWQPDLQRIANEADDEGASEMAQAILEKIVAAPFSEGRPQDQQRVPSPTHGPCPQQPVAGEQAHGTFDA